MIGFWAIWALHATIETPLCNPEKADAGIQREMNICAAEEFTAVDKALNEQWKITITRMKQLDENSDYDDGRPGYEEALRQTQHIWIAFRDAHCRNAGYKVRGGSLEPMLVANCKTALTAFRIAQLKDLTKEI